MIGIILLGETPVFVKSECPPVFSIPAERVGQRHEEQEAHEREQPYRRHLRSPHKQANKRSEHLSSSTDPSTGRHRRRNETSGGIVY